VIAPNDLFNWKMAVRAHVQACFDREAELKARIESAGTAVEISAVDIGAGWP
jgi:hypothetical protein